MKYELINYCENNKYAKKAYSLIHNEPESKNLGDITLINEKEIADFNWMVGGSPCQDFSVAGKGKGAVWTCKDCKDDEGNDYQYNPLEVHYTKRDKCPKCNSTNIEKTRSSLVVEWLRILLEKKPNVAIYENVKNLVGKKHRYFFDLFIQELHEYGYNTYWKVLNAKNYGVPQNRERVYLIIIKKELDNGKFKFPEGFDNGIRLKDILEKEVDEKYYINQEKTDKLIKQLKDKEYSNTVRASGHGSTDRHMWDLVAVLKVGNINPSGKGEGNKIPTGNEPKILVENELKFIGGIDTTDKWIDNDKELSRNYKEGYRVYDSEGIATCQKSNGGGIGSYTGLYTVKGCSTRTRNYAGQSEQLEVRKDEVSNSITTVQKDGMVLETNIGESKEFIDKHGYIPEMFNPYNCSEVTDVSPTTTQCGSTTSSATVLIKNVYYRIRKLTPLECFRLMGFADQDFHILKENKISDTQCYKMAGNSIVVDVLYYICLELYRAMPYLFEDIKLGSFFSGIGAFEKAIKRLQNNIDNKYI